MTETAREAAAQRLADDERLAHNIDAAAATLNARIKAAVDAGLTVEVSSSPRMFFVDGNMVSTVVIEARTGRWFR